MVKILTKTKLGATSLLVRLTANEVIPIQQEGGWRVLLVLVALLETPRSDHNPGYLLRSDLLGPCPLITPVTVYDRLPIH